jgi:hypothetical protein
VSAQQRRLPHPVRISVTIPWGLDQRLPIQADLDGRSLSNLIAFLLEETSMW